jgi:hypothetical protein
MADVLISYARRDRGLAARLAGSLEERGLKVVWDVADLSEGDLRGEAKRRLDAAPAVVALWSEHSLKADWVREEALAAEARGALVSATLDANQPPALDAMAVDLSIWAANGAPEGLDLLISAIAKTASQSAAAAPEIAPAKGVAAAEPAPPAPAPTLARITAPAPYEPRPGEVAAQATFIMIAFLILLGIAVDRQASRTPVNLPPIDMSADQPLQPGVIAPTPEEENAPSGLTPLVPTPQESTGSTRK